MELAGTPAEGASASGVAAKSHEVDVAPSGGAYVRSGADDAATDGTPYVIDTKAQKYPLIGPDVAPYIGYGDSAAPVVPNRATIWPGVSCAIRGCSRRFYSTDTALRLRGCTRGWI